ncbi:hypothetical protein [Tenacibaculum sp. nBUS_03]|uniref:hypothetical protein n=1 Tax=Tenacibaculum sp. nBUS_03 TaxID=3395320 RepID=UPI003EB8F831
MKRLKLEELPEIFDNNTIDILAHMANETPQSKEWHDIFDKLTYEQLRRVMDRKGKIQMRKHQELWDSLSEEEQAEEKRKRQEALDNPDRFYGNMGQPETIEDLKNRYGEYPPGYDENGNKIVED